MAPLSDQPGELPPPPTPASAPPAGARPTLPYPGTLDERMMTPGAPLPPGAAMRVYPIPLVPPGSGASVPAQWAADPGGQHELRWWDGARWTDYVADAGETSLDPLP